MKLKRHNVVYLKEFLTTKTRLITINRMNQLVDIDEIQFGLVSYQDVQLQTTLLF